MFDDDTDDYGDGFDYDEECFFDPEDEFVKDEY